MNMPDDVAEARKAFQEGDFAKARAHLAVARQEGADQDTIRRVLAEIDLAERAATQGSSKHLLWAIVVAVVGYIALSYQAPWRWGTGLWILLAFFVVPVLSGWLAGSSLPPHSDKGDRFKRAMKLAAFMMALYAMPNMLRTHAGLTSGDQPLQIFGSVLVSTLSYALGAGLVAGFATRLAKGGAR